VAKEEEMAAEPEKSGVDDDETDASGTTPSLPLLDRVALVLVLVLLLATVHGNDAWDALAGIGEEAGAISVSETTRELSLVSPSSNASVLVFVLVVRLDDDDNGAFEFELEFEFVAPDDATSAMAGTNDIAVAAASPQHQSPCFQFRLLSSLVAWFILLRYEYWYEYCSFVS